MATGWQLKAHSQDTGDKRRVVQRRGWRVASWMGSVAGLLGPCLSRAGRTAVRAFGLSVKSRPKLAWSLSTWALEEGRKEGRTGRQPAA